MCLRGRATVERENVLVQVLVQVARVGISMTLKCTLSRLFGDQQSSYAVKVGHKGHNNKIGGYSRAV